MSEKINYENEARIFLKLKAKGAKTTQKKFCEDRSAELGEPISLHYFRKVLSKIRSPKKSGSKPKSEPKQKRYDWDALKTDYMLGNYSSLSDFARTHGIAPKSESFRKKTATWKDEKEKIGSIFEAKIREALLDGQVAEKYRSIHAHAFRVHLALFDLWQEVGEAAATWGAPETPEAGIKIAMFISRMQKAVADLLPSIHGLGQLSEINAIFDQLSEGKIDIAQVSIELMKLGIQLPRALEILLTKHVPMEPEPDEGDWITEQKILEKRREMRLAEIEHERTHFVAERTEYVNGLKREMKGSWDEKPEPIVSH